MLVEAHNLPLITKFILASESQAQDRTAPASRGFRRFLLGLEFLNTALREKSVSSNAFKDVKGHINSAIEQAWAGFMGTVFVAELSPREKVLKRELTTAPRLHNCGLYFRKIEQVGITTPFVVAAKDLLGEVRELHAVVASLRISLSEGRRRSRQKLIPSRKSGT